MVAVVVVDNSWLLLEVIGIIEMNMIFEVDKMIEVEKMIIVVVASIFGNIR